MSIIGGLYNVGFARQWRLRLHADVDLALEVEEGFVCELERAPLDGRFSTVCLVSQFRQQNRFNSATERN